MATKVTGATIADNTIEGRHLQDNSISPEKLTGQNSGGNSPVVSGNPFIGPNTRNIDAYKRSDINPVITAAAGSLFVADPFAIVVPEHDRMYVIYEDMVDNGLGGQGRISVSYSDDGEVFVPYENNPVVDELSTNNYHSSYPSILRWGDTFYMLCSGVNNANGQNDVRLYKTTLASFPGGWSLVGRPAVLNTPSPGTFDSGGISDPTIFMANGMFYCIYGGAGFGRNSPGLAVKITNDLENLDGWFKQDRAGTGQGFALPSTGLGTTMRPGGSVLPIGNNAFVTFQQANTGSGLYARGQSVVIGLFVAGAEPKQYYDVMQWNRSGPNNVVPYLSPSNLDDWEKTRVHHLSFVRFRGKWIGVYDGYNDDAPDKQWRIGIVELPDALP